MKPIAVWAVAFFGLVQLAYANNCPELLDPTTSDSSKSVSPETQSYISLLRALVNEKNAINVSQLYALAKADDVVSSLETFDIGLDRVQKYAYRQAFRKLVVSSRLDWDVIRVELELLVKTKTKALERREEAVEKTALVVRDFGKVDSKPRSSKDVTIDGVVYGVGPFITRNDPPYIGLVTVDSGSETRMRASFVFNPKTMRAVSVPANPETISWLSDGKAAFASVGFGRTLVYDADTGKAIFDIPLSEVDGLSGKLKNNLFGLAHEASLSTPVSGAIVVKAVVRSRSGDVTHIAIDPVAKKLLSAVALPRFADVNFPAGCRQRTSRAGDRTFVFGLTEEDRFVVSEVKAGVSSEVFAVPFEKVSESDIKSISFESSRGEAIFAVLSKKDANGYLYNSATGETFRFSDPRSDQLAGMRIVELGDGKVALVLDLGSTLEWNGPEVHQQAFIYFDGRPVEHHGWATGRFRGAFPIRATFAVSGIIYQIVHRYGHPPELLDPLTDKLVELSIPYNSEVFAAYEKQDGSIELLVGKREGYSEPFDVYRVAGPTPATEEKQ